MLLMVSAPNFLPINLSQYSYFKFTLKSAAGWIDILNLHRHLTTSQFLTQNGSLLQSVNGAVGIDATLEPEAGIGAQTMPARTLSDPCRMEIGTLEHYITGFS
jgi:hypothetical protein